MYGKGNNDVWKALPGATNGVLELFALRQQLPFYMLGTTWHHVFVAFSAQFMTKSSVLGWTEIKWWLLREILKNRSYVRPHASVISAMALDYVFSI